jgi:hypothetical protein
MTFKDIRNVLFDYKLKTDYLSWDDKIKENVEGVKL